MVLQWLVIITNVLLNISITFEGGKTSEENIMSANCE